MERNVEIVRQWRILRTIAANADCTVSRLAADHNVCTRTIYRDLEALQSAGFPLFDERVDRKVYWRLSGTPFKGLRDTAFSFSELCSFYVNRSRFAATGGSPVEEDFESAISKLTEALSPKMRQYLDRLSGVLTWKPDPGQKGDSAGRWQHREELVRATLEHRTLEMTYHSFSSRRVKRYRVEPYRLTFGHGGLYLYAYVPAYGQMRTFAVQRIRALKTLEEHFSPVQELSGEPFQNSFGPFSGDPQRVSIQFAASVAPYVEECQWHPSQEIATRPDGSIVLKMNVCVDLALRSWILGFGHQARVLAPSSLARTILEELEEAREQYAPRMQFELPRTIYDDRQSRLPFPGERKRGPGATRRQRQGRRTQPGVNPA